MDPFNDSDFPVPLDHPQPVNLFCDHLHRNIDNSSLMSDEKIATFLRIRPLDNLTPECTPYVVKDSNQLYVEIDERMSVYNSAKKAENNRRSCNFNHIFDSSSNQLNVFTKCCLPLVNDVLEGTNALLFCFGTTSSGKSYTMRGPSNDPASDPGLIPLSLKKIFSSRQFIDAPLIGKSKFNDICLLDKDQQLMEKQFKESILSSSCCRNVSALPSVNNEFNFNKDGYQYICYLSYFEIYNDIVYDLLVPSSNGRSSPLTLFHDERQRFYVKDLKSVMVSTLTEALQIYSFGWTNLQRNIQETGLNKNSSRSHSFLCITLIKFKEDEGQVIESQVSHLTLGDLAGTERQNVTDTEGMRVKEGGNINVSLMHLKECFNQTKLNQKNPSKNFVIPFRNSSLTKFFQPYLTGTGRVWMIININPSPNLLQETLGSLKLGKTASDISVNTPCKRKFERSTLQMATPSQSACSSYRAINVLQSVPESNDQLNETISKLKDEVDQLKTVKEKEIQLMRDNYEKTMEEKLLLSDRIYQSMIIKLQARNEELLKGNEKLKEEMKKPSISTFTQTEIDEQFVSPVVEVSSVGIQTCNDEPVVPTVEKLPCETQTEFVETTHQECQTATSFATLGDQENFKNNHQYLLNKLKVLEENLEKTQKQMVDAKTPKEIEFETQTTRTTPWDEIEETISTQIDPIESYDDQIVDNSIPKTAETEAEASTTATVVEKRKFETENELKLINDKRRRRVTFCSCINEATPELKCRKSIKGCNPLKNVNKRRTDQENEPNQIPSQKRKTRQSMKMPPKKEKTSALTPSNRDSKNTNSREPKHSYNTRKSFFCYIDQL